MKRFYLLNLIFTIALTVFSAAAVKAQNAMTNDTPDDANGAANRRADSLRELGLSAEQMQQFRRINAEKRPAMRLAQQRLKEATRALDEAVYADAPDESNVQTRIKESQAAQSEVIRIRSMTELAVRRILTAEQLGRFREARRRFEAAQQERRMDKKENRMMNAPNRGGFRNRRQRRINAAPNN